MKCSACETGKLVAAVRDVPHIHKGKKTVIKAVKGRFCDNPKCREVVMDMDESMRTSRDMLEFNKKVNAKLTPINLLTEVRERLKLTQQQAAGVFGGGPNAFSRYESGKTKPPVALVKLFRVLNKHPELFEEEAQVLMLRAQLMSQLRDIARSMTPREAARRFGVSPRRLNHLLCGRIGRLNIDALISMLRHAGMRVELRIRGAQ